MRKQFIRTILFPLALLSLLSAPSSGQVKNAKRFSIVPTQVRERLVERFNLYIEYDRTHQYAKLYDLYSESYVRSQKLSKESFLQLRESIPVSSRSVLIEYKPISVSKPSYTKESGVYTIVGWAKIQQGGKVIVEDRILEVRLESGDWFFSGWLARTDLRA